MPAQAAPNEAPALPWFRDANDLPAPLPSKDQIEAATVEFSGIYASSRRVVLVNDIFIVKYGSAVHENEGHALLFVEGCNDVPAPRLYAMYRDEDKLYLVMEFVPGKKLSDVWQHLSEEEKAPLLNQLRLAYDCLRSMPSPGYHGGVFGGPLQHRYFFSASKDPQVTGPFSKADEVCRALVLRSADLWISSGQRGWMTEFFARHLHTTLSGHGSLFTHADFQRKNILVQEEPSSAASPEPGKRTLRVAAILDWESAGWYPSYWAYASCFVNFSWTDDWPDKVETILDTYVNESTLLWMVKQNLDM